MAFLFAPTLPLHSCPSPRHEAPRPRGVIATLLLLTACGQAANEGTTNPTATASSTVAPVAPSTSVTPVVSPSSTAPGNVTPLPTTPSVTPSTSTSTVVPQPPAPPGSVTPTVPPSPPTSPDPTSSSGAETSDPTATTELPTESSDAPNDTGDNPPTPASCSELILCEDFESASGGVPDPATWTLVANYTYDVAQTDLVQVGTEQKHGGAQALHVAANGLAGIVTEIAAQKFYVRAFMRVDAAPVGPVLMGIGTDHNSELRFRIQQNSWGTVNIIPSDAVLPQAARDGNCPTCPKVTPNEWFCMEFFVDAATKSAGLWLDGVESVNAQGLADFPGVGDPIHLRFGTMDLQGGSTGLWLDDIAVGAERIGCD
jgi:hypothetical protein